MLASSLIPRAVPLLRIRAPTVVSKRNAWVFERSKPHRYIPPRDGIANTQEDINRNAWAEGAGEPGEFFPREGGQHIYTYTPLEEDQPDEPVRLILIHDSEDHGNRGQIVTVENPHDARRNLLLPGLAVYATEDNLNKYADILIPEESRTFSSAYAKRAIPLMARTVVPVTVSSYNEWELDASHLRACFQKVHINVPVEAIEMPSEPIRGPDPNLEHREFLIHVLVNEKDRFPVRCVIHHADSPKLVGWMHVFHPPALESQSEDLRQARRPRLGPKAIEHHEECVQRYQQWRTKRDDELKSA